MENNKTGAILLEAHKLINGQRQEEYGDPKFSLRRIAELWSAYLEMEISARDVACLMALQKIGREAHEHKKDNLLDAAGYIGLAADAAEDGKTICMDLCRQ